MIRVDYLDELVWQQLLELLRRPEVIRAELERRRQDHVKSNPVQQRREQLERELNRSRQQMDKLLDAYQEDLLSLAELRKRAPELKKKIGALEQEHQNMSLRAIEDQRWSDLNQSLETFLARLNQTVEGLTNEERQKIVRLLIKQIDVRPDTITIHHSIPVETAKVLSEVSSPLYTRQLVAASCSQLQIKIKKSCAQYPVSHQHPPPEPNHLVNQPRFDQGSVKVESRFNQS